MKRLKFTCIIISILLLTISNLNSKTKIMPLGVFHFHFPNADAIKTDEKDIISVFEEPYKSEIIKIVKAINEFKPTKIAVEITPDKQERLDQQYNLFINNQFDLSANEVHQLGFRIAKSQNLEKLYCIDDFGIHYSKIMNIFNDSLRTKNFEDYFYSLDLDLKAPKIESIIKTLIEYNDPDFTESMLSRYLTGLFLYEEKDGDFAGVDFETGRWFNRNLRIFRNIQRIPVNENDRILLIIGSGHLSVLNHLFKVSKDFEFVSPLPYLKNISNN